MKSTTPIILLARSGYAARGIVYLIVALFAILAGMGAAAPKGSEDALLFLLRQPAGALAVWIMIGCLFGFALWRLTQSIGDTDDHGRSAKGLAVRAGLLGSAITYSLLALFALGLVVGSSGGGSGSAAAGVFGGALSSPFVVYAVAAVLLGVAIAHIVKAFREKFRDHIEADADMMRVIAPISKIGLVSRGLIFALLAVLLVLGVQGFDASEPPSTKEALQQIQDLPFGSLLLIVTGAGLLAFSVYSLIESVYRRVEPHRALEGENLLPTAASGPLRSA